MRAVDLLKAAITDITKKINDAGCTIDNEEIWYGKTRKTPWKPSIYAIEYTVDAPPRKRFKATGTHSLCMGYEADINATKAQAFKLFTDIITGLGRDLDFGLEACDPETCESDCWDLTEE